MAVRKLVGAAIWAVIAGVVVLLFINSKYAIIFGHTGSYPHYLQTTVPSAFEVIPGERMVAGGNSVGEITSANVTKTGQAHIVMGLDNSVWPIPSTSVLTLRMGGTIKYTDRFIEITKGTGGAVFPDNASVPANQFIVPVEYNQLFNVFNKQTRSAMQGFFSNGGQTFQKAAAPFHKALGVAPPVLNNAAAVFNDLGYDQQALSTLVSSTAEISDAVQSSNPGVQTLIQSAGNTFGSIATESTSFSHLIDGLPANLFDQGQLYYHVGHILYPVARLARRIGPGIAQLNAIAAPLDTALRQVMSVEPVAVHTLSTVESQGPAISSLLTDASTKLMPGLSALQPLASKEIGCIRPYTPDAMAFLQGWSGFLGSGEMTPTKINFLHSYISIFPLPNSTPLTTQQATQLLPGLTDEWVGVPGTDWGPSHYWYQPQCNVTPAVLNPALDDNNNTYDPIGSKLINYPSH